MTEPVHVTANTFEAEVIRADVPVLVDFWAAWCGPCLMIAPVLEQIAKEYEGKLKVAKLDVDNNQELAIRYEVMSIPNMIVFKDGKAVERLIGYMPRQRLMEKILPHL